MLLSKSEEKDVFVWKEVYVDSFFPYMENHCVLQGISERVDIDDA